MAKLTPMQQAYKKEMQRLKRAIRREYKKTGIELDSDLIPETPKRVTQKQLQKIKSIKPKDLRRQSQYIDYETGEILNYEQAKEYWQNEQKYVQPNQLNFSDTVISGFMDSISQYNDAFQNKMRGWLNGLINQYGKDAVSNMLMEGTEAGVIVTNKTAYSDVAYSEYITEMLEYLDMDYRTREDILGEIEAQIGYEEPD